MTSRARRRPRTHPARAAVALLGVLAAGACGDLGSGQAPGAGRAALAFATSSDDDPARACGLLAPRTRLRLEGDEGPCASSLPGQDLPRSSAVRAVEVYGKSAVVRLDRDTVFLARFDQGWRVTAAGCRPSGDEPYDCTLEGG